MVSRPMSLPFVPTPCLARRIGVGRRLITGLLMLTAVMAQAASDRVESFASLLPFPVRIESVIEQGSIHGYPVAVARATASMPHTAALAVTRQAWRERTAHTPIATHSGSWSLLSMRESGRFVTVQMRASSSGGTEALISIWRDSFDPAPKTSARFDPVRILPPGSRVVRQLTSTDSGAVNQTLVALIDSSPAWVAQAVDVTARGFGFARQAMALEPTTPPIARLYRSDTRELGITVHGNGEGAALVIHLTEKHR